VRSKVRRGRTPSLRRAHAILTWRAQDDPTVERAMDLPFGVAGPVCDWRATVYGRLSIVFTNANVIISIAKPIRDAAVLQAAAAAALTQSSQGYCAARSACQSTAAARLLARAHSGGRKIQTLHEIISMRESTGRRLKEVSCIHVAHQ
jgi:hypothetical protein